MILRATFTERVRRENKDFWTVFSPGTPILSKWRLEPSLFRKSLNLFESDHWFKDWSQVELPILILTELYP